MTGYRRTNRNGRYEIRWEPEHTEAAASALAAAPTPVDSPTDAETVDLDNDPETQEEVRRKYEQIVTYSPDITTDTGGATQ